MSVSLTARMEDDATWRWPLLPGWTLKQLKWAVTFQRGHDLPTEERQEGSVPVFSGSGISGWHNTSIARGPGIVTGRYGTIGDFYLIEEEYWPLNTALYSIDLHHNDVRFLRYMLESLAPLFHLNAAKSAVPGVDRADIHTIPVAIPPISIQRAIAAFLDSETTRLEMLVSVKERVLKLLTEKRRSLITRAVTRGLDSRAPIRDSGIPWLGGIPAHWTSSRLKFVAHVRGGLTLGKSYGTTSLVELPYLRVANVQDGYLDLTRRLAQANPTMLDPTIEAEAVVLIDEIDLHLHPKWQRQIVRNLTATFPRCQFIATTHSPQVIGEVEHDRIQIIADGQVYSPTHSFGVDSSRVLEEIMEADPRSQEVKELLSRLSANIGRQQFADARQLLTGLVERLGEDDPEVTRVRTLLDFMEGNE